jgi:hypothetical protein
MDRYLAQFKQKNYSNKQMLLDNMFEKTIFINCSATNDLRSHNEIQKGLLLRNIHKKGFFMNRYY